jgi:hypothetical protein
MRQSILLTPPSAFASQEKASQVSAKSTFLSAEPDYLSCWLHRMIQYEANQDRNITEETLYHYGC